MRFILKIILSAIIFIEGSVMVNAQGSATASASAGIIDPMMVTPTKGMYFGNVATGKHPGKIIISTSGLPIQGKKLSVLNQIVEAASFEITAANEAYAITVQPEPIIISSVSGKESMRIHSFNYTSSTKNLLNTRTETLLIGATLTLSSQAPQTPVLDTFFTITANYN